MRNILKLVFFFIFKRERWICKTWISSTRSLRGPARPKSALKKRRNSVNKCTHVRASLWFFQTFQRCFSEKKCSADEWDEEIFEGEFFHQQQSLHFDVYTFRLLNSNETWMKLTALCEGSGHLGHDLIVSAALWLLFQRRIRSRDFELCVTQVNGNVCDETIFDGKSVPKKMKSLKFCDGLVRFKNFWFTDE